MDEALFYISQGDLTDAKKSAAESFAYTSSIHSSKQYQSYRHASSPLNGACITGIGPGERIFTCDSKKALINVYSYGKEGIDQRIPVPEALTTLHIVHHPHIDTKTDEHGAQILHQKPTFRVPWLICGGSKSGKLYIWELSSGDLLCVKEAHYQGISVIKSSSCKTFLVTGGDDARVLVWNLADLISIYGGSGSGNKGGGDEQGQDNLRLVKPYWAIAENTLSITDITLNPTGVINDLKLYTSSKDGTVRIFDVMTKSQLTTFILPHSAECLSLDPANRAIYVGLSNGQIKMIPLYKFNSHTSVLEGVGGMNKIITIDPQDPNLSNTFVQHADSSSSVLQICVSMDGTSLISGDSKGQIYVADIVTKQTIKGFPSLNFPIAYIHLETISSKTLDVTQNSIRSDKKHRMVPTLKRVLASSDPVHHTLFMDIPERIILNNGENGGDDIDDYDDESDHGFSSWLERKRIEELQFRNLSDIDSTVKTIGNKNKDNTDKVNLASNNTDLELKLKKVSEAYTDLRSKYEQLIKEHAKLLDDK
ncbi:IPI3 [Candida theae]|uniref:Pre-rRNA-processing protein IPI3 n=1 Tax=Candida theae TaxID=1198502 RepID=A0AAD5BE25_9ASCO|nr:IPI3 [Candida theae]KAI5957935.1 IPI3 [Candida theae]